MPLKLPWENDKNFHTLFDFCDKNIITSPASETTTKNKTVKIEETTEFNGNNSINKPDLNLISSLLNDIGESYSNDIIEEAYGINGIFSTEEHSKTNEDLVKFSNLNPNTPEFIPSSNIIYNETLSNLENSELSTVEEKNKKSGRGLLSRHSKSKNKRKNVALSSLINKEMILTNTLHFKDENVDENIVNTENYININNNELEIAAKCGKNDNSLSCYNVKYDCELSSLEKVDLWLATNKELSEDNIKIYKSVKGLIPSEPQKFMANEETNKLYKKIMGKKKFKNGNEIE